MSATAVHLHIFYKDMWPQFKYYLSSLNGTEHDLYVTLIKEDPKLEKEIHSAFPEAVIWHVPNCGYDIGPFFYFLRHIDLGRYDYILKLHGKNEKRYCITRVNGLYLTREIWNRLLYRALLGSPKIVKNNLKIMAENPQVGLISSRYLITDNPCYYHKQKTEIKNILQKMGLTDMPKRIKFVAGTMFLIRTRILRPLLDAGYDINSFKPSDIHVHDGTLAHTMERVLGAVTIAQGYRICGFDTHKFLWLNSLFHNILRFVFQKKVSKKNYLTIKILKVTVYRKKLS